MLLARLSEAAGVSGQEDEVRNLIKAELDMLGVTYKTDALGNVLAYKPGRKGRTTVMAAAHGRSRINDCRDRRFRSFAL